jgi:hypothetical protein
LKTAAERLGLEVMEGQTTHKYYGSQRDGSKRGVCLHAIRIKGQQDGNQIGIVARVDGGRGFSLNWDPYGGGGGLVEKIGARAEKLKQGYAVEVATRAAQRSGFRVVGRTVRQDGKVELKLQR